jgi:hypothetical protein
MLSDVGTETFAFAFRGRDAPASRRHSVVHATALSSPPPLAFVVAGVTGGGRFAFAALSVSRAFLRL